MLKNSLVILSLILISTGCYTIREHPVVKGVVDGQYHAQSVDYMDDCAECHSTGEIDEFDLMPLYAPEKTYGEMKFYSDSLSNIALFYGEVGWWYRFTPMVYEYTEGGGYTENEDGYFVPSRGGYDFAPPPPNYPGTPTQSSSSTTKTKERSNTTPSGDGSNNTTRSSADRPDDPGKSRNSNNGRKSGRK